jgi:hypothetical protein
MMMLLALALSLPSATVGLHVVEINEMELDRAISLAHDFADAIEDGYGHEVRVGSSVWSECEDESACARELAVRDGAAIVILLRMYKTPNFLLVAATRARSDGRAVLALSRRLREGEPIEADLRALVQELFADQREEVLVTHELPQAVVEDDGPPWFWIGAGVSAGLGAIGLGFSLGSLRARQQLLDGADGYDRVGSLEKEMREYAIVGNVFFVTALLSLGTAILLEVIE